MADGKNIRIRIETTADLAAMEETRKSLQATKDSATEAQAAEDARRVAAEEAERSAASQAAEEARNQAEAKRHLEDQQRAAEAAASATRRLADERERAARAARANTTSTGPPANPMADGSQLATVRQDVAGTYEWIGRKAAEAKSSVDDLGRAAQATDEALDRLTDADLVNEQLDRLKNQATGAGRELPGLTTRLAGLGRGLMSLAGGPIGIATAAFGYLSSKIREVARELEAEDELIKSQLSARDEIARQRAAEAQAAEDAALRTKELNDALAYQNRLRDQVIAKIDETIAKLLEEQATLEQTRRMEDTIARLKGQEELESTDDPVKRVEIQERLAREQEERDRQNLAARQAEAQAIAEEQARRARQLRAQLEANTKGADERIQTETGEKKKLESVVDSQRGALSDLEQQATAQPGSVSDQALANVRKALEDAQRDLEDKNATIARMERVREEDAARYKQAIEEAERASAEAARRSQGFGSELAIRNEADPIRARIGEARIERARRAAAARAREERERQRDRAAREGAQREQIGRQGGDVAEDAVALAEKLGVNKGFANRLERAGKAFEKDPSAKALEELLTPLERLAAAVEQREGRASSTARAVTTLTRRLEAIEGRLKNNRDDR